MVWCFPSWGQWLIQLYQQPTWSRELLSVPSNLCLFFLHSSFLYKCGRLRSSNRENDVGTTMFSNQPLSIFVVFFILFLSYLNSLPHSFLSHERVIVRQAARMNDFLFCNSIVFLIVQQWTLPWADQESRSRKAKALFNKRQCNNENKTKPHLSFLIRTWKYSLFDIIFCMVWLIWMMTKWWIVSLGYGRNSQNQ